MKNLFLIIAGVLFFAAGINTAQAQKQEAKVLLLPAAESSKVLSYPVSVMAIIDAKCFGCHSPSGKNDKAKQDLLWEALQTMDNAALAAKLDEIVEVVEKGEMPPKGMVEKFPNMKLTDAEATALKTWAEKTLNTAIGE